MEEISVDRVLEVLITKAKGIIMVLILGAVIGFVYSQFFIEKEYKATTTFIMPKSNLIDEYTEMIKTDAFLESVSQRFGVSIGELKEKTYIDLKDKKTYNVHVVYKGQDPQLVTDISLELANKFVAEMIYNYKLEDARVTERPDVPTTYYNYSEDIVLLNVIKMSIGLTCVYLFIILSIEFISNKVKTERFVNDVLKIKVLSTIALYDKKKNRKYYEIQCDNLVNRINKVCKKNKALIMFSNVNQAKETFEEIVESYAKISKKVLVLNLDNKFKMKQIQNVTVKDCTYSEIKNFVNEYEYVLINGGQIDGVSFDEKILDIIDSIIILVRYNKTKISDLEKSIKILDTYKKIDDTYCVVIGETVLQEKIKYRKFVIKNK